MAQAAFVYEDALSRHVLRSDHPMRPARLRHTYELLAAYGAFDGESSRLIDPRAATEEELEWVHTPEYVAAVRSLSTGLNTAGSGGSGINRNGSGSATGGTTPSTRGCTMRPY